MASSRMAQRVLSFPMARRTMGTTRTQSVETTKVVRRSTKSAIYRRQTCITLLRGAISIHRLLQEAIPSLRISKYCRERSPMIPHIFFSSTDAPIFFRSRVQQNTDLDRDSLTAVSTGGVKYSRSEPLHRQCSTFLAQEKKTARARVLA